MTSCRWIIIIIIIFTKQTHMANKTILLLFSKRMWMKVTCLFSVHTNLTFSIYLHFSKSVVAFQTEKYGYATHFWEYDKEFRIWMVLLLKAARTFLGYFTMQMLLIFVSHYLLRVFRFHYYFPTIQKARPMFSFCSIQSAQNWKINFIYFILCSNMKQVLSKYQFCLLLNFPSSLFYIYSESLLYVMCAPLQMVMSFIDKWPIIILYTAHLYTETLNLLSLHRQTPKLMWLTQKQHTDTRIHFCGEMSLLLFNLFSSFFMLQH